MYHQQKKSTGLYRPEYEHDACGMGFIAHIDAEASRDIVDEGLIILERLVHRGGTGAEPDTGDGAGILMAMPDKFMRTVCAQADVQLPEFGKYAVAQLFLPKDKHGYKAAINATIKIMKSRGYNVLYVRDVPYSYHDCGPAAQDCMPSFAQIFISGGKNEDFELGLYILRRTLETKLNKTEEMNYYVSSLSSKTIVYKGMLHAWQLRKFFPDLDSPDMETAICTVHSRFSTNTFPSWDRAQPCRYIAHNGEINTLTGNENWFHARETVMDAGVFGRDLNMIMPVIDKDGSDSTKFDNCIEFLTLSGKPMPQVLLTMIPEAWSKAVDISPQMKAFYEYSACTMEPWDGPAAICFSDGISAGAILDRNGLRPARYMITKNRRVVLASEAGVLDMPADQIIKKGKLGPGEMILVDTDKREVYNDREVKELFASDHPYEEWLDEYRITPDDIEKAEPVPVINSFNSTLRAFGYTFEALEKVISPMINTGKEPISAMGMDIPLAVLSSKPQPLFNYFKQLFAQVTNPPIDALREEIVTGTELFVGANGNFAKDEPSNCKKLKLESPVIDCKTFAKIKNLDIDGFKSRTLSLLYDISTGGQGLRLALDRLFIEAEKAIDEGCSIIILSDRGFDKDNAGIPSLLAVSGLHHHLIHNGLRGRADLILDSAEPYEVHHFACLFGFGVSAVHPWGAISIIKKMIQLGYMDGEIDESKGINNYLHAIIHGIVKIMSKMGISAIAGYQGSQIFEILGINKDVVDKYFTGATSRIGGLDMDQIATELSKRHRVAFDIKSTDPIASGGTFQYKVDGEKHLYNPETIHLFQNAVRLNSYQLYKKYSDKIIGEEADLISIRSLLDIVPDGKPISLEEVEPVERIVRRFKTGAMSYGSLGLEAHECLAIAMNRLQGKSNSGEGGEDARRFKTMENGDSKCSAIKQVASGRFGVTAEYLASAVEIQIKMAQGAKPGEGGHLPSHKVYPWIAKVRHSTPGVGLISPPPHHDIYSIEDLAQLIYDLKNNNPGARINVKLVSEAGVGTIAAGVAKAMADVILISGYDGGTGASPRTSTQHAGLPWELGVAETHQTLVMNGLRDRVLLETDGKMMTGRDIAIAALLGAEEYGFATLPLVAMGCIMMRVCNLNTCPVGVATQNPELRERFTGKPEYVENCMHFIAMELREIMAELGYRKLDDMIGRTHHLKQKKYISNPKAAAVDLSDMLSFNEPITKKHLGSRIGDPQWDHFFAAIEGMVDREEKVNITMPINNTDRTTGTRLGGWLAKRYGDDGIAPGFVTYTFEGTAGQSFGAFLPQGVNLDLTGDANDYVGKGLCGGEIVIRTPKNASYIAEENIIIGNVTCYGATTGKLFVNGLAGERFCVRNSGVKAVVEGIGDHGCEYMTGGIAVILGETGYNFAAGMSGGLAYIYDINGDFSKHCNHEMVSLVPVVDAKDVDDLKSLIKEHTQKTGSNVAGNILKNWDNEIKKFIKVYPNDYRDMLNEIEMAKSEGLTGLDMLTKAFERKVGS